MPSYTDIIKKLMKCLDMWFTVDIGFIRSEPFFICKILDANQRKVSLFNLKANCMVSEIWIEPTTEEACASIIHELLSPDVTLKYLDGHIVNALSSVNTIEALMIFIDITSSSRKAK